MRFITSIFLGSSFVFVALFLLYSCSDSSNELKRITDLSRDTRIYEDTVIEEDFVEYEDITDLSIVDDVVSTDIEDTYIKDIITVDDSYSFDIADAGTVETIEDIYQADIHYVEDIVDIGVYDVSDIVDTYQCTNLCQKDEKRCKDSNTLEICADSNADGCYEYVFFKTCENGCANNDCIPSQCDDVQLTDPDLNIPSESSGGKYETTRVNGFNDDYLYNVSNYTKVGVRREWGGSVIFFGLVGDGKPGINPSNTIDANDTGREVQVAFYDPDRAMQNCAYNASCATTPSSCQNSITFLGWDPVQGGNRCNVGSGVESVSYSGGVLSVSTIPLFWNPDWDRSDCDSSGCNDSNKKNRKSDVRVIQRMRYITQHVIEIDYTVENLSDLEHRATYQEMPTMYTSNGKNGTQDLYKLFDSQGNVVRIDVPAGGDGFNYKNFQSPDGWVAMQNGDVNYGVGIYYENKVKDFQGWQLRSLPFNNVRALFNFGIPARGNVRARAYLSLGNLDTIKAEFASLDSKLGPFGSFDVPANDSKVSGDTTIYGWALDNKGVSSVYAVIDGKITAPLTYGTSRPDVCKVWPGYNGCSTDKVGFSGSYDFSKLSKCPHLIEVYAVDGDNNIRKIGSKRVYVE